MDRILRLGAGGLPGVGQVKLNSLKMFFRLEKASHLPIVKLTCFIMKF